MNKYKAKVKYNGNHYFAEQEVIGSRIYYLSFDKVLLFNDEPIPEFPFYGEGRNEWVEIDPKTLEEIGD
jgi:hypothetical protein